MLRAPYIGADFESRPRQGVLKGKHFTRFKSADAEACAPQRTEKIAQQDGGQVGLKPGDGETESIPEALFSPSKYNDQVLSQGAVPSSVSGCDGQLGPQRSVSLADFSQVRPQDIVRAARRSVQEQSKSSGYKPQRRVTVDALEQQFSSNRPRPTDSKLSWLLPPSLQRDSVYSQHSVGESNGVEAEAVKCSSGENQAFAYMMDYVPAPEIANRLFSQIKDHENKFAEDVAVLTAAVAAEAGPATSSQLISKTILCDEALDAATMRDASGLSGRTDVLIPLKQLKKGMQLPPTEIPTRFYQEKIQALGVVTPDTATDGSAQPCWDAKSRQWKTYVMYL